MLALAYSGIDGTCLTKDEPKNCPKFKHMNRTWRQGVTTAVSNDEWSLDWSGTRR
jgi:hypothetical protein